MPYHRRFDATRRVTLLAAAAMAIAGARAEERPFCPSETSNPWQHRQVAVTASSLLPVREKIAARDGALPPSVVLSGDERHYLSIKFFADDLTKKLSDKCEGRLTCPEILDNDISLTGRSLARQTGDENAASPLGYCGPLGPYGPLGRFGPLGEFSQHDKPEPGLAVPQIVRALSLPQYSWLGLDPARDVGSKVLGEDGPLGPNGPLGKAYCTFSRNLPEGAVTRAWSKHLQPGGVWTPLGPLGPLGALGPLGPLGRLGGAATFFDVREGDDGRFVYYDRRARDRIRHCLGVPTDRPGDADCAEPAARAGTFSRRYELVEFVPAATARTEGLTPLHTSFVIDGRLPAPAANAADRFTVSSRVAQYVTIVVVPGDPKDAFDLSAELPKPGAAAAATLTSTVAWPRYINFIQAYVDKGQEIAVTVRYQARSPSLPACLPPFSKQLVPEQITDTARGEYRLIMVGGGSAINGTDVSGAHQIDY